MIAMIDDPQDGWSLPAWTYRDPEFFELEQERVFASSWQVVCHQSDVPNPGDWHTLDYLGESVIVLRGADRSLRAFYNVCRHRGSRLLDGASGCAKKLVCPYHAWTYDLDGALAGVPDSASYPGRDDIRDFLSLNPSFRLLVAHGYADLVTPYGVSRYVLDHLPELGEPDRVQLKVYPGGHMFYFAERPRMDFTSDVTRFYQAIQ